MCHFNSSHTKQQQGHCWKTASQTLHLSLFSAVKTKVNDIVMYVSYWIQWIYWRTHTKKNCTKGRKKKKKNLNVSWNILMCLPSVKTPGGGGGERNICIVLCGSIFSEKHENANKAVNWWVQIQSSLNCRSFHTASPDQSQLDFSLRFTSQWQTPAFHLSVSSEINSHVNGLCILISLPHLNHFKTEWGWSPYETEQKSFSYTVLKLKVMYNTIPQGLYMYSFN